MCTQGHLDFLVDARGGLACGVARTGRPSCPSERSRTADLAGSRHGHPAETGRTDWIRRWRDRRYGSLHPRALTKSRAEQSRCGTGAPALGFLGRPSLQGCGRSLLCRLPQRSQAHRWRGPPAFNDGSSKGNRSDGGLQGCRDVSATLQATLPHVSDTVAQGTGHRAQGTGDDSR